MLSHDKRVESSLKREEKKRTGRSPEWHKVAHAHLAVQPNCAACGGSEHPQVHHIRPFHLHPELELDPANLITLCMGPAECHVLIGHGDNFRAYNPNVVEDAAKFFSASTEERKVVTEGAKKARLMS